jgi:predicted dehydrogenase
MRAGALQRWGIAGVGSISRTVVPDLASCQGVEISIVQSRDAGKADAFAQEFGISRSTGDFGEVLADPLIDAVYIATPFATHHALAKRALLAGKHVLVEKPIAMNAAEAADLFAVAARMQVFLMEAMWMKFNPAFRRLHDELAAGRIGEVRSMRASFGIPFPAELGSSRWDHARSPGSLLDQGIYPVTLAHTIFGQPVSIHAAGSLNEDGIDFAEHFTLEFEGGRFAQCASGMTEFCDPSASVSGRRGWISIPAPFWARTALDIHADSWDVMFRGPHRVELGQEGNGYVPMLREVVESINSGACEHAIHPASETIAAFHTLDAIRRELRGLKTESPTPQATAGPNTSPQASTH